MKEEGFDIDNRYMVKVKINSELNPPRPIYDAEISMVLIDKEIGKEIFHISNHHWHPDDKLGRKLSGHPSMKTDTSREIFLNLSEGQNPKQMSFDSLKINFLNECCLKIDESYKDKLKEILDKIIIN